MYAPITPVVNFQSMSGFKVPDTTQRFPLNFKLDCFDPFWGYGEFVYGKAAAALAMGNLVVQQATLGTYDKMPNTAALGQPCLVATNAFAINTFGWFQKSGVCVVASTATVAAAVAVGLTGAGTVGAVTNGKQISGYIQLASQTGTKAITNVQTVNGSGQLFCASGYDGFFLGATLTGTGLAASTVVAALDPDGKTVYMGSAIGTTGDKLATATGLVTVTATFTGFSIAHIESPFGQGQVV